MKLTIDEVKKRLETRSIEPVSKEYINNSTKMSWRCLKCKNEWTSKYNTIQSGRDCTKCKYTK